MSSICSSTSTGRTDVTSRKSQAELPNILALQSSATLGTGAAKTHQERLERDEDKQVRQAMDRTSQGKRKGSKQRRRQPAHSAPSGLTDESGDGMDSDVGMVFNEEEEGMSRSNPVVIIDSGFSTAPAASVPTVTQIEVGSALQRNADGSAVAPRISERKPKQAKVCFTFHHESWHSDT